MIDILVEICGWIGALSYAVYCIPQSWDAYKKGHTEGLSSYMVLLLFLGALFSFLYILPDVSSPLFYNFSLSLVTSSTLLRYHFFPRK